MTPSWKLLPQETQVLVQGMTGKEGMRMTKWLLQSGVKVCAGVTPGKGGMLVEGCPIFDTVAEACVAFPRLTATSIVVPPSRVLGAVKEALEAGIRLIHVLTESVPVHDVIVMRQQAMEKGARILGPSSVGYLQFPAFRLGYIGGERPFEHLQEGDVGLISTSGGMVNELMMELTRHQIGLRMALAVGGDRIPATSLEEAIRIAEDIPEVKRLVVFAEPGRAFFQQLLQDRIVITRPLTLFLAGDVLDDLPRGKAYGHAGTLLGEEGGSVAELRGALRDKGIACVATSGELIQSLTS